MTVWLALIAACLLIGIVSWWMSRRGEPDASRRLDRDWGDWPSDQMGQ